jgi:uncharacterized protein YkwD
VGEDACRRRPNHPENFMTRRLSAFAVALTAGLAVTAFPAAAPALAAPSACQSTASAPSHGNIHVVRKAVLCLLNRERTKRGLKRLRNNKRLETAATKHSKDMVRRNFFSHDSPGGSTPGSRVRLTGYLKGANGFSVGENIAWGTGRYATAESIVDSWMNSPGHKANILHRAFDEIGIGVALGAPGEDGGATYTTNFGARL